MGARGRPLRATDDGQARGLWSVMLKLAGQNLSEAEPPAWVRFMFYSHPTIAERVALADSFPATE